MKLLYSFSPVTIYGYYQKYNMQEVNEGWGGAKNFTRSGNIADFKSHSKQRAVLVEDWFL